MFLLLNPMYGMTDRFILKKATVKQTFLRFTFTLQNPVSYNYLKSIWQRTSQISLVKTLDLPLTFICHFVLRLMLLPPSQGIYLNLGTFHSLFVSKIPLSMYSQSAKWKASVTVYFSCWKETCWWVSLQKSSLLVCHCSQVRPLVPTKKRIILCITPFFIYTKQNFIVKPSEPTYNEC